MERPPSCTENSRGSESCAHAAAHTAVSSVRSWLAQLHPEQLFLWSAGGVQSGVQRCLFPRKCHAAAPGGDRKRIGRNTCEMSPVCWDWCGGRFSASLSLSPSILILSSSAA